MGDSTGAPCPAARSAKPSSAWSLCGEAHQAFSAGRTPPERRRGLLPTHEARGRRPGASDPLSAGPQCPLPPARLASALGASVGSGVLGGEEHQFQNDAEAFKMHLRFQPHSTYKTKQNTQVMVLPSFPTQTKEVLGRERGGASGGRLGGDREARLPGRCPERPSSSVLCSATVGPASQGTHGLCMSPGGAPESSLCLLPSPCVCKCLQSPQRTSLKQM